MMPAKDVKNLILTLIILLIGINAISMVAKGFTSRIENVDISGVANIITSFTAVISIALAIIIIILMPIYLSKRSQEKYPGKQ
jgi:uncharacterized membrane protein